MLFRSTVAASGDGCEAGESSAMYFTVFEDNGVPVIKEAASDGKSIVVLYNTDEKDYKDGWFEFQIMFFSLTAASWTSFTKPLQIIDGQAVIDLGVVASNGYLYIRPVTTPESNFVEIFIE